MSRRPLLLLAALVAAALVPMTPVTATASSDYQQVVDLTFPFTPDVSVHWPDTYDASRGGGRHHQATDLMVAYGTPVHAVVGGTVTRASNHGWGFTVTIRGADDRSYHYLHLGRDDRPRSEAIPDDVTAGTEVARGQLIGFAGCSGSASCGGGEHLHLEIHDDRVSDPYDYHDHERINPWPSLKAAVDRGDYPGSVTTTRQEPDTSDWRFVDVPPDGAHHDDIVALVDEGWASGCADRRYCPLDEVTREGMAQFLAGTMRGVDPDIEEADTDHFDDDDGSPHEADINLIAEHGISVGTGERTFTPDRDMTRAEMSTFLIATFEFLEGPMSAASHDSDDSTFEDVSADNPFADDIATIAQAGVTTGCTQTRFCPADTVLRSQMASFLVRGLLAD